MIAREQRWREEAAYFDRQAQDAAAQPALDSLAVRRYCYGRRRRRFEKEFRYLLLGRVAGLAVLDVGCGEGANAALLARLGATVTGLDLSPQALAVAEQRARASGVAERTRFVCSPLEVAPLPAGSFDVVWVDNTLHHLTEAYEEAVRRLVAWARPGGRIIVAEPVNLCAGLRRLRCLLPLELDGTPGERPLEPPELALLCRTLSRPRLRHFGLFSRLDRVVLPNHNYERAPAHRRALSSTLACLDYHLLALPGLRRLASNVVVWGEPKA